MNWILLAAGFVVLYLGAESLVRGSVRLAVRFGIAPLIIGLTVVAFGTSAPELFVSIKANLGGSGDMAVGNIIGSNIFNLALILGFSAILQPIRVKSQLISQDIPVMIGASILFFVLARDLHVSRIEGGVLFTLLVCYIGITIFLAKKTEEPELTEEIEHHIPKKTGNLVVDLIMVVLGIGLLVAGSNMLVTGGVKIAEAAGVSQAVIGLTLIAGGTGLPELATAIVAAVKKETDLAVGNVVGSNIFNVLCIGGISPIVKSITSPDIEMMDFYVMIGFSVLVLPLCITGMRIGRREGVLLISGYIIYLFFLWPKPI